MWEYFINITHSKMEGEEKQKQREWENQMEEKSYSEFLIFRRNRESRSDDHTEKSTPPEQHFGIKMKRYTTQCYKMFSSNLF